MRKIHIKLLLLALMPVIIFSCVKENDDSLDKLEKFYLNNPEAIAQVKFIHAYTPLTINGTAAAVTSGTTTTGTGFRITMDGNKINGAQNTTNANTNTLIWGGVFPATTAYAFLPPGAHTFKFIMNRLTGGNYAPIAGDEVFTTTLNLTAGKRYSMFIADPYGPPAPLVVEDNFDEPGRNGFGIRFINLVGDPAARYDIISTKMGAKLFSNIGYKELTNYNYYATTSLDTIYLRNAGTTTVVSQINGFTPGSQRVYTLYARGKTGVTGRTPSLAIYTNR